MARNTVRTNYVLVNHVFLANKGRDDEFEVLCNIKFAVAPGEPRTRHNPGCEAEIEDIEAQLIGEYCFGYPPAVAALKELIEEELEEDPAALWDHVAEEYWRQQADSDRYLTD